MTTLYANPYGYDNKGFYFESLEEFEEKKAEDGEYEIDYINGENPALFSAVGINQTNLETWFEDLDELEDDDDKALALRYLCGDLGYKLAEALDKADAVTLYQGSLLDYAIELFDELYEVPRAIRSYIDYEAFARDLELSGDVAEIEMGVYCINPYDF